MKKSLLFILLPLVPFSDQFRASIENDALMKAGVSNER